MKMEPWELESVHNGNLRKIVAVFTFSLALALLFWNQILTWVCDMSASLASSFLSLRVRYLFCWYASSNRWTWGKGSSNLADLECNLASVIRYNSHPTVQALNRMRDAGIYREKKNTFLFTCSRVNMVLGFLPLAMVPSSPSCTVTSSSGELSALLTDIAELCLGVRGLPELWSEEGKVTG